MEWLGLIMLSAATIEAVWETLKMIWQEGKLSWDRVGALVVGLVLAFAWPLDFFALAGYPLRIGIVGNILTGILFSRGANFVHDLWKTYIEPATGTGEV